MSSVRHNRVAWVLPYITPYMRVGRRVLDAGCGDSSFFHNPYFPLPYEIGAPTVVSYDIDTWKWPNFVKGDIHHLPFKDYTFDVVLLRETLEHLVNPLVGFSECLRVCRGILVGTTPNHDLTRLEDEGTSRAGIESDAERCRRYSKSPETFSSMVDEFPQSILPHIYHIQIVSEQMITTLLKSTAKPYILQKCLDTEGKPDSAYWGFVVKV